MQQLFISDVPAHFNAHSINCLTHAPINTNTPTHAPINTPAPTPTQAPINMIINSDGGSVAAGLAIHDTMRALQSPVRDT